MCKLLAPANTKETPKNAAGRQFSGASGAERLGREEAGGE